MAKNFPNLKKETDIQVQESQRVPNKMNPNRPTPRHILIKMARVKGWASLVAQWLRIHLPMQGTQVQALVQEDPTCRRATKPVHHNY